MAIPGFYNLSKGALASLILLACTCTAVQANDPAAQVFFSSGGPAQGGHAQSAPSVLAPVVSAPVDTGNQTFFSTGGPRSGGLASPYPQTNTLQPAIATPIPQAVAPAEPLEPLPPAPASVAPAVATAPAEPEPAEAALPDPALFTQQSKMGEQTPEHSFSLFGFGGAKTKAAAPAANGAVAANAPAAAEPPLPDPALFTQQAKMGEQTPEHAVSLFGAAPAATPVPATNTANAAVPADGNTATAQTAQQQTQQQPDVPNSDLFTQTPKQGEEALEHPFKLF